MKTNILITICLFFSSTIFAQDYYRVYVDDTRNLFQWGDQNYQKNMQGLNSLMTDLQEIDPDLYDQMEPNFAHLQQRNKEANIILGVGAGGAIVLLTAGVLASFPKDNSSNAVGRQGLEPRQANFQKEFRLILAGGLVGILSSAIYFKKSVKPTDILDFTNRFNRHSKGDKIEFTLQPEIGIGNGGSAGLALRFTF